MPILWQYQQLAHVPNSAKERATPDKWLPLPDIPRWDAVRQQHLYIGSVGPISPTFIEGSTPDKWVPLPNLPVFDLKRQQATYPNAQPPGPVSAVFAERASPDKWLPVLPAYGWDAKRTQALYPSDGAFVALVASTWNVTWYPSAPDYIYRRPPISALAQVSAQPVSTTYAEQATPDRWSPILPAFAWDVKRHQALFPSVSAGPVTTTFAERATIDKWFVHADSPQVRTLRMIVGGTTFIRAGAPAFNTLWFPQAPDYIFRPALPAIAQSHAAPVPIVFTELLTMDKWWQEIGRPVLPPRTLHLGATAFLFTPKANIPVSAYWQYPPCPFWPAPRVILEASTFISSVALPPSSAPPPVPGIFRPGHGTGVPGVFRAGGLTGVPEIFRPDPGAPDPADSEAGGMQPGSAEPGSPGGPGPIPAPGIFRKPN